MEIGLDNVGCFQILAMVWRSWKAYISKPRKEILEEVNLPA
jgi:hypothetical protein